MRNETQTYATVVRHFTCLTWDLNPENIVQKASFAYGFQRSSALEHTNNVRIRISYVKAQSASKLTKTAVCSFRRAVRIACEPRASGKSQITANGLYRDEYSSAGPRGRLSRARGKHDVNSRGSGDPWSPRPSTSADNSRACLRPADVATHHNYYVPALVPRDGTTVAERLRCSPPTKANGVQFPAGSLPDFRTWESCWLVGFFSGISRFPRLCIPTLLHLSTNSLSLRNRIGRCRWSAGFLGDLQFPTSLHSDTASYSPRHNVICSQAFDVNSSPKISIPVVRDKNHDITPTHIEQANTCVQYYRFPARHQQTMLPEAEIVIHLYKVWTHSISKRPNMGCNDIVTIPGSTINLRGLLADTAHREPRHPLVAPRSPLHPVKSREQMYTCILDQCCRETNMAADCENCSRCSSLHPLPQTLHQKMTLCEKTVSIRGHGTTPPSASSALCPPPLQQTQSEFSDGCPFEGHALPPFTPSAERTSHLAGENPGPSTLPSLSIQEPDSMKYTITRERNDFRHKELQIAAEISVVNDIARSKQGKVDIYVETSGEDSSDDYTNELSYTSDAKKTEDFPSTNAVNNDYIFSEHPNELVTKPRYLIDPKKWGIFRSTTFAAWSLLQSHKTSRLNFNVSPAVSTTKPEISEGGGLTPTNPRRFWYTPGKVFIFTKQAVKDLGPPCWREQFRSTIFTVKDTEDTGCPSTSRYLCWDLTRHDCAVKEDLTSSSPLAWNSAACWSRHPRLSYVCLPERVSAQPTNLTLVCLLYSLKHVKRTGEARQIKETRGARGEVTTLPLPRMHGEGEVVGQGVETAACPNGGALNGQRQFTEPFSHSLVHSTCGPTPSLHGLYTAPTMRESPSSALETLVSLAPHTLNSQLSATWLCTRGLRITRPHIDKKADILTLLHYSPRFTLIGCQDPGFENLVVSEVVVVLVVSVVVLVVSVVVVVVSVVVVVVVAVVVVSVVVAVVVAVVVLVVAEVVAVVVAVVVVAVAVSVVSVVVAVVVAVVLAVVVLVVAEVVAVVVVAAVVAVAVSVVSVVAVVVVAVVVLVVAEVVAVVFSNSLEEVLTSVSLTVKIVDRNCSRQQGGPRSLTACFVKINTFPGVYQNLRGFVGVRPPPSEISGFVVDTAGETLKFNLESLNFAARGCVTLNRHRRHGAWTWGFSSQMRSAHCGGCEGRGCVAFERAAIRKLTLVLLGGGAQSAEDALWGVVP
ncbi:hypothetical protein PR048_016365 [Dryococelus australis]|uniref:Uncharacterized protein n=1 Tax=Dryococelus australis TaxID=614101 RepID=A0ABQ9HJJ2_9NEOP|nr:hypothetical protein PR048_016365 [Dryococelus australis]